MPQAQVVDLSPIPAQETNLEKTLAGFTKGFGEARKERKEIDALREIYSEQEKNKWSLDKTLKEIQTRPGISPNTRVKTVEQLMQFQKYNSELMEKSKKDINAQKKIELIEKERNLEKGSLEGFADNPALAERITRPNKVNQADRSVDPEQMKIIRDVRNTPEYQQADADKKYQILTDKGVSTSNAKNEADQFREQQKTNFDREKFDKEQRYKINKDLQKEDDKISEAAKGARNQLQALGDVDKSIDKVNPNQFSNVFRHLGPAGKAIADAFLTKDQAVIQASIPAFLEGRKELFGVRLSDADLALLQDKMPDIGKSREANKAIIKIMKKYSELAILKESIGRKIKNANEGYRPVNYLDQVNETFDEMTKPVKIIRPGSGKVISVPAFKLEDALLGGATLYNE